MATRDSQAHYTHADTGLSQLKTHACSIKAVLTLRTQAAAMDKSDHNALRTYLTTVVSQADDHSNGFCQLDILQLEPRS